LARALANECSRSTGVMNDSTDDKNISSSSMHKRVAFFMRKGADCLSKWVKLLKIFLLVGYLYALLFYFI
jgi:SpoVK/Ycf46/Vps4 family AAA+-type ATPase